MAEAANTESTEEFLPRLGAAAKPGAQAVLVLDEAGRGALRKAFCRARKVSAAVRPGNRSDGAGRPLPEGEPLRQPGVRRRRRPDGGGPQGAGPARRRTRQDRADGVAEPDRSFALSNLSLIGSSHFFGITPPPARRARPLPTAMQRATSEFTSARNVSICRNEAWQPGQATSRRLSALQGVIQRLGLAGSRTPPHPRGIVDKLRPLVDGSDVQMPADHRSGEHVRSRKS